MNNKKYTLCFVFLSSVSLSLIYMTVLRPIYEYNLDRIYDLRQVPIEYRVSLQEDFIDRTYENNAVLLLGDSQPYGYRHVPKRIFSRLLSQKLGKKVFNLAFADKSITDNINTLNYIVSKKMRFDSVIFNVNQAHPKSPTSQRLDLINETDYKLGIVQNRKAFEIFIEYFNPKADYTRGFFQQEISPDYYNMPLKNFSIYLGKVEQLISLAKLASNNVIIYETPYAEEDVKRLQLDMSDMEMFTNDIKRICSKHRVVFLKPNISKIEYFDDLVHFSKKGHVKMAQILYETIQNNQKTRYQEVLKANQLSSNQSTRSLTR
ncbi:SGNH/GDSL hydrolase family protein [Gimesia fumaroli]|nr:SGNH/GDSL hydrolase family protein [Gimesia fumaroli]